MQAPPLSLRGVDVFPRAAPCRCATRAQLQNCNRATRVRRSRTQPASLRPARVRTCSADAHYCSRLFAGGARGHSQRVCRHSPRLTTYPEPRLPCARLVHPGTRLASHDAPASLRGPRRAHNAWSVLTCGGACWAPSTGCRSSWPGDQVLRSVACGMWRWSARSQGRSHAAQGWASLGQGIEHSAAKEPAPDYQSGPV